MTANAMVTCYAMRLQAICTTNSFCGKQMPWHELKQGSHDMLMCALHSFGKELFAAKYKMTKGIVCNNVFTSRTLPRLRGLVASVYSTITDETYLCKQQ